MFTMANRLRLADRYILTTLAQDRLHAFIASWTDAGERKADYGQFNEFGRRRRFWERIEEAGGLLNYEGGSCKEAVALAVEVRRATGGKPCTEHNVFLLPDLLVDRVLVLPPGPAHLDLLSWSTVGKLRSDLGTALVEWLLGAELSKLSPPPAPPPPPLDIMYPPMLAESVQTATPAPLGVDSTATHISPCLNDGAVNSENSERLPLALDLASPVLVPVPVHTSPSLPPPPDGVAEQ